MTASAAVSAQQRPTRLDDVKGWFPSLDQLLFHWFLARQARLGERGDLMELGTYMGKSAIFTAAYLAAGERYTVCDLFDGPAPDEHNAAEHRKSYSTLTRIAFEQNFLAFHDELPEIIQGTTSVVPRHVSQNTCRFVHVDASHLYEHVAIDINTAHDVLKPRGIVVMDDFRSEHTPGVAAATWEAVFTRGLHPICLSTQKLYGTWDDPRPFQDELLQLAEERGDVNLSRQEIAGRLVLRLSGRPKAPEAPKSRFTAPPKPAPAPQAKPAQPVRRSPSRKLAADILPPVVTRALRRRMKARAEGA